MSQVTPRRWTGQEYIDARRAPQNAFRDSLSSVAGSLSSGRGAAVLIGTLAPAYTTTQISRPGFRFGTGVKRYKEVP